MKLPYRVLSLDIGRDFLKVLSLPFVETYPAVIAEADRELTDIALAKFDFILEYNGKVYWGGNLAGKESDYLRRVDRTDKVNETFKLLAVIAMHRFVQDKEKIIVVTFQPISEHNAANKEKFKRLLRDNYTATLNGVTKSWSVIRVEVAAEGAVAAWGFQDTSQSFHIIDVGSVTTNCATCMNRGMVNKLSKTFQMGIETVTNLNLTGFTDAIYGMISRRWLLQQGPIYLIGGRAEELKPEFERYYRDVIVPENPAFANALGGYVAGVRILEKETAETTAKGQHITG